MQVREKFRSLILMMQMHVQFYSYGPQRPRRICGYMNLRPVPVPVPVLLLRCSLPLLMQRVVLLPDRAFECLIEPFKRISNFVAIMMGNRYCRTAMQLCNLKVVAEMAFL